MSGHGIWTVDPVGALRGTVQVPGDKSVSHRSLLLNAVASGHARVRGLLRSEDTEATVRAVRALGVEVEEQGHEIIVRAPVGGLREPDHVVDCGNSGTTMRLLAGVVSAIDGHTVLSGDASLRRRPMGRVVRPLTRMGAHIDGRLGGSKAPLAIRGGELAPCAIETEVASAQVKSAVLLAGLRCGVSVREPGPSRDHTERMLQKMGAKLDIHPDGLAFSLAPAQNLRAIDVDVPRDISAAAFWLVAGAITPGSEIALPGVGVNPTRAGILDALAAMGCDLSIEPLATSGAEPIADLFVRNSCLTGTTIEGSLALRCLDELPVLAVAASFAQGETVIADAAELRVKESDRIRRTVSGLRSLGVQVEERPDGMVIQGGRPTGPADVDASGDHRIAMAFAVAALAGAGPIRIHGAESIRSSYPTFRKHLEVLHE